MVSAAGIRSPGNNRVFLEIAGLSKSYRTADGRRVRALTDCSFTLNQGEVLGVVGESGCGKSTLGRCLLRLSEPDQGSIRFRGLELTTLSKHKMKMLRRDLQMVFQDPFGSLNPRHSIGTIISEPLRVHRIGTRRAQQARVNEILELVGLDGTAIARYPHEFSGGQRQRIAIARALILNPEFLVADEAVSALDVSVQSQMINLIMFLRQKLSLSMLFISHDLSVIRHVCDRIAVMYLGRIVELGETEAILQDPQHPYSRALVSAVPQFDSGLTVDASQRVLLSGELPDPASPPSGCSFHTRCPQIEEDCEKRCEVERPELVKRITQKTIQVGTNPDGNAVRYDQTLYKPVTAHRECACHLFQPLEISESLKSRSLKSESLN